MSDPMPVSGARMPRTPHGVIPAELDPAWLSENAEEAAERRARGRAARLDAWWSRVPRRFASATISDLTPAQDPDGIIARWWASEALTLVLRSDTTGNGKTHAAYAVANDAVTASETWAAAWYMPDLNEALRPGGDDTALDTARQADLVLIDDLGRERISEWTLERLAIILDARSRSKRLRTIVTTNLTGEALVERYGTPVVDRLRDAMWFADIKAPTRRAPAPF